MNRRKFLKTTAVAVAGIVTPIAAIIAKDKPKTNLSAIQLLKILYDKYYRKFNKKPDVFLVTQKFYNEYYDELESMRVVELSATHKNFYDMYKPVCQLYFNDVLLFVSPYFSFLNNRKGIIKIKESDEVACIPRKIK